jgi:hypothetical protein
LKTASHATQQREKKWKQKKRKNFSVFSLMKTRYLLGKTIQQGILLGKHAIVLLSDMK